MGLLYFYISNIEQRHERATLLFAYMRKQRRTSLQSYIHRDKMHLCSLIKGTDYQVCGCIATLLTQCEKQGVFSLQWRQVASLLLTRTGTAVPSRANRGRRAREFPRKLRDKFLANRLLRCTCDNPALASHIFKSPALTFPPMKH